MRQWACSIATHTFFLVVALTGHSVKPTISSATIASYGLSLSSFIPWRDGRPNCEEVLRLTTHRTNLTATRLTSFKIAATVVGISEAQSPKELSDISVHVGWNGAPGAVAGTGC